MILSVKFSISPRINPSLQLLRQAEQDKIYGLSLGADDFIVKPFSPRELVLRE